MIIRALEKRDMTAIHVVEKLTQPAPWAFEVLSHCFDIGAVGYVVEMNDQLVGFIMAILHPWEGHILNLCVHPRFQRQGIGRALMQCILQMAQEKKVGMICLEVRCKNVSAIALYKSMGFIQIGERKNYYPTVTGREDALVFAKDLGVE